MNCCSNGNQLVTLIELIPHTINLVTLFSTKRYILSLTTRTRFMLFKKLKQIIIVFCCKISLMCSLKRNTNSFMDAVCHIKS